MTSSLHGDEGCDRERRAGPGVAESVAFEPVGRELVAPGPAPLPALFEPAAVEPGTAGTGKPEPGTAHTGAVEPGDADHDTADPGKADCSMAEPGTAGNGAAGSGATETGAAGIEGAHSAAWHGAEGRNLGAERQ